MKVEFIGNTGLQVRPGNNGDASKMYASDYHTLLASYLKNCALAYVRGAIEHIKKCSDNKRDYYLLLESILDSPLLNESMRAEMLRMFIYEIGTRQTR